MNTKLFSLVQEQRQLIQAVKQSRHKRIGQVLVSLSYGDKANQIHQLQNQYYKKFESYISKISERNAKQMNINLKEKVSELIDGYRAAMLLFNDGYETELDKFKLLAAENGVDPLVFKQSLLNSIGKIRDNAIRYGVMCNKSLKELIATVKNGLFSDTGCDKPADYATQISNALNLLKIHGEDLTDDMAYMILGEFVDDVKQMSIFKSVIAKQVKTDAEGDLFPKTFRKINAVQSFLDVINEIELIAEDLFTYSKTDGKSIVFGDLVIPQMAECYEQMAGEQRILELADDLEKMIAAASSPANTTYDNTNYQNILPLIQ